MLLLIAATTLTIGTGIYYWYNTEKQPPRLPSLTKDRPKQKKRPPTKTAHKKILHNSNE